MNDLCSNSSEKHIKLKRYLADHHMIENIDQEIKVNAFTQGFSNHTYLITSNNASFVLRHPPKGAVKRGHNMEREYTVLSRIHQEFKKCPKPILFYKDLDVLGVPFYIMEKIDGVTVDYQYAAKHQLTSSDYQNIFNAWIDTWVSLHNLDYKACGLGDFGKPNGYVERQVLNWGRQYKKAATKDVLIANKVIAWLDSNQPKVYDHCLIHNDYKYDNVLFQKDDFTKLNAVIDWEMATLGDPLMDLGASLAYWTTKDDPDLLKFGLPSPTMYPGNPNRSELINVFSLRSGRPIHHITFYYTFGLFRLATIAQQIYYRYHHGLTDNKKFENLEQSAELLCNIAWKCIQTNKVDQLF